MKSKIVIEINGCVVQEVYCDDPNVEVVVVDWDMDGSEPDDDIYLVQDKVGYKHLVHAVEFPTTLLKLLPQETRAAVELAR